LRRLAAQKLIGATLAAPDQGRSAATWEARPTVWLTEEADFEPSAFDPAQMGDDSRDGHRR
jgi:rubredoxin